MKKLPCLIILMVLFISKGTALVANQTSTQHQDTVTTQWLVLKIKPRAVQIDSNNLLVRISSVSIMDILKNFGLKEKVKMMYQLQQPSSAIRTMVGQQLIQPNYNNVFKILLSENIDTDALVNALKSNHDVLSVQRATTPKLD